MDNIGLYADEVDRKQNFKYPWKTSDRTRTNWVDAIQTSLDLHWAQFSTNMGALEHALPFSDIHVDCMSVQVLTREHVSPW